jgi:leucyl-tRNA synthetase
MEKKFYDHVEIEKKAQEKWQNLDLYTTDLTDTTKDPYYLLVEFPYPSGDLHVGHWYAFSITDIYARYLRAKGKNVLFPFGFDAFGLPAENAAIKHGKDPMAWTYENMETMKKQVRQMGTSLDFSKEIRTCDPQYYRWTQWLFAKLYEHNLAYKAQASVKWCPKDQTVLANEQVHDGLCERCGTLVEEKNLTQWFLKITAYADRLLSDLESLPWRDDIKEAQRAWIGRSAGAEIIFKVKATIFDLEKEASGGTSCEPSLESTENSSFSLQNVPIFTTRPDTVYGATYLVLAPEHPLIEEILNGNSLLGNIQNSEEVKKYIQKTSKKTERERSENKEKTGVELKGISAVNPATLEDIPVYIAEYVLASYGTGAVMAVPAHDERDYAFAKKYSLPITQVVMPSFIDETNPHVVGKEYTKRDIIIGVVYNPKTDRYLCLEWKEKPWTTFITGGIEEGEDAQESALREIIEETGYTDLKFIRLLGGVSESKFFAAHKDINRTVKSQGVLFELLSETRTDVREEEKEMHETVWIPAKEIVSAKLQHAEFKLLWERIQTGNDVYTGEGILIHSDEYTGRNNREAFEDIISSVQAMQVTKFRLRDWGISRQRYWGCPIPVVYDPQGNAHLIPSEHLPWTLPTDVDFTPTGNLSPLATSVELKERVIRIFGEGWTPEYDTLDTFVDSSWYFARYLSPTNTNMFSDEILMKKWLPVNRYSGGSEHTTMHLLYARFFYKALYDLALVPTSEPFIERFNRGLIMGPDGQKMSKSKGNVENPDEYVSKYGADAVRCYLSFIGPYNEAGNYPWKPGGVASMRKFLDRVYGLREHVREIEPSENISQALARAILKVDAECERFKFNTALSALMILLNELQKEVTIPRSVFHDYLKLLAPFAPHLCEELFTVTGGSNEANSIHMEIFPKADESLLTEVTSTIAILINGKKRWEIQMAPSTLEAVITKKALSMPEITKFLGTEKPKKVIYVQGKILNIVV